ncbi:hypothetical protein QYE76_051130 [Lolium multiflorum]|uniref:CCR4-NOT transcription complex subunit 4 n=1 Tax=Lolium multiflorum TaxID=4521 RepID=A0AAD8SRB5_LOLMU|nr:hypothetical protein QYE76_051130 [Lolium multiflorum]
MSTQAKDKCPLCLETMDLTDKHLKPCKCGYEICLWCWHHIMEMDQKDECGGRCPGCRSIYNKDRILETSTSNQILKELCADKSNLQQEQMKLQKQKPVKSQTRVVEEPIDPNVRVIQRKLVYIIGMPSELASEKVLRQKSFLGQYGKIENIIIDNIGANQQLPDSGRVYVTFSREEEAVLCIESVNGYILDGRPLKATFGVTRYCHIWLSNKVCQKPNCSYVHYRALAEDICTKDDVGVFCARLQHLLGMNMTGPQQRSGSTLPPPGGWNSKTTICTGNSKDKICINDGVVPRDVNKNPGTLTAAILRDSVRPSCKPPSIVNAAPHRLNNHESVPSQQKKVSSKSPELPQLGPKGRPDEQLASSDDKSQASAHLGVSDSKQMASAVNGTVETSWKKPQYANIVSQGSSAPSRRFTVLTRESTSTDTRSKATGQEGIWVSKKLELLKDVHNDRISVPRSQNLKVASQIPEEPLQKLINQLSSVVVKSHTGAEEKSAHSHIKDTPAQGKDMQLSVNTAASSATVLQSISPTVLSNLSTSDAKTQTSVGTYKLPNSHRKLASESEPQILHQQKASVSDKDVASVSDCRSILSNQAVCSDGKHQTSAQGGDHSSCPGKMTLSGDQTSSEQAESIRLIRPVCVLSSTDILAKDSKGRKSLVCPPGFKVLHKSSDSGNSVSMSSSTCSALCSTSDAPVQESCSVTDQPDIISWVSECLDDGGDTRQSNSVSIPSTLSPTDTIWRPTQLPGPSFGASNNCTLPPYPGGMLQCMSGDQNPMICCCTFPSVPNQMPEYWNGGASSYMAPGGYNTFYQNTASGMRTGMVGTLLQQPSPPGLYADWTNGNADPGLNSAQVGHPYSVYSLF